jgi:hypothetical protein
MPRHVTLFNQLDKVTCIIFNPWMTMNITNLKVQRNHPRAYQSYTSIILREQLVSTTLTVLIDGVPFSVKEEQSDFIMNKTTEQQEQESAKCVRFLVTSLANKIAEKLLEEHIAHAVLNISSADIAVKELAKLALKYDI